MGERTLRRLSIIGSSTVVKYASCCDAPEGSWLTGMLARKPRMLVTGTGKQDGANCLGTAGEERELQGSGGRGDVSRRSI